MKNLFFILLFVVGIAMVSCEPEESIEDLEIELVDKKENVRPGNQNQGQGN